MLSCSCTHSWQMLSLFSALFSILCCRSLSYSLNLERIFLCIFFLGLRHIHVWIPASCTSSQQAFTKEVPPPAIYWMASPPVLSTGAPRTWASWTRWQRTLTLSILAAKQRKDLSFKPGLFGQLCFLWLCRWISCCSQDLNTQTQTGKSPRRPWSFHDATYFWPRFN